MLADGEAAEQRTAAASHRLTIRVFLGRNFEERGEGGLVPVDGWAYPLGDLE